MTSTRWAQSLAMPLYPGFAAAGAREERSGQRIHCLFQQLIPSDDLNIVLGAYRLPLAHAGRARRCCPRCASGLVDDGAGVGADSGVVQVGAYCAYVERRVCVLWDLN